MLIFVVVLSQLLWFIFKNNITHKQNVRIHKHICFYLKENAVFCVENANPFW